MKNANTAAMLPTVARKSLDRHAIWIEGGCLSHAGGTFTRHAPLKSLADALELAEAVSMFDRVEMPSLAAAAAKLAKRGPLSLWPLVEEAARLSHRAGTRPADMPRPTRPVNVVVWIAAELATRAAGVGVCPRHTVRRDLEEADPN